MGEAKQSARWALKAATDAQHHRLDARLAGAGLASPRGYALLLAMNRLGFLRLEHALRTCPGNPHRDQANALAEARRLVEADLAGCDTAATSPPADMLLPETNDRDGFALGIAYVTEGARLGSRLILREIEADGSDRMRANARYLRAAAADEGRAWPGLLARLDDQLGDPAARDAAIRGAIFAFDIFENALETCLGGCAYEAAA